MHEKRLQIRWRDQDAYAHVNQAVYTTYFEETLDSWLRGVLGLGEGEVWDYVVARIAIDYRAELRVDDGEAVGSARLERTGTKSVTARAKIRAADGRLAAEAEIVIVARDPSTGESRALTEAERAAFEAAA